jgi:hypothetical protein
MNTTPDENDFLTYQLYTASKTPRIKKARVRGWILTIVLFLCLAFLFFESSNAFLGYYFLLLSVVSLPLYPIYSRWRYKKHYKKYIADTYKGKFGVPCTIQIENDVIVTKDATGEFKIKTTEVEVVNEIKDFYFVKMKSGMSLIVNKVKTDPQELEILVDQLMELVEKRGVQYNRELDWKWR